MAKTRKYRRKFGGNIGEDDIGEDDGAGIGWRPPAPPAEEEGVASDWEDAEDAANAEARAAAQGRWRYLSNIHPQLVSEARAATVLQSAMRGSIQREVARRAKEEREARERARREGEAAAAALGKGVLARTAINRRVAELERTAEVLSLKHQAELDALIRRLQELNPQKNWWDFPENEQLRAWKSAFIDCIKAYLRNNGVHENTINQLDFGYGIHSRFAGDREQVIYFYFNQNAIGIDDDVGEEMAHITVSNSDALGVLGAHVTVYLNRSDNIIANHHYRNGTTNFKIRGTNTPAPRSDYVIKPRALRIINLIVAAINKCFTSLINPASPRGSLTRPRLNWGGKKTRKQRKQRKQKTKGKKSKARKSKKSRKSRKSKRVKKKTRKYR